VTKAKQSASHNIPEPSLTINSVRNISYGKKNKKQNDLFYITASGWNGIFGTM